MNTKVKNLSTKNKIYTMGIALFFVIVLILGIKSAYAYYYNTASKQMLAVAVGDFDGGDGDINIMIYKETSKGSNLYTGSYAVPAMEYQFEEEKTACTFADKKAECKKDDSSGDCYYTYDEDTRTFALTSNQKVTCKFYFSQKNESDINVYIMIEDAAGIDKTWKEKHYRNISGVPAYGYVYAGYSCDNDSETDGSKVDVHYDAETKKFTVSTPTRNKCYAYFNSVGSSDITTNVYVQKEKDSNTYTLVNSIPANKTYKLATSKDSKCFKPDKSSAVEGANISYEDGYVNINNIGEKVSCDVYLDLE